LKTGLFFLLFSFSAFSNDLDSIEALIQTVPFGIYSGRSESGSDCLIQISKDIGKATVTLSDSEKSMRAEVYEGASYRWNPSKRLFFSSNISKKPSETIENLVRTIGINDNDQFIVVADILRDGNGTRERKIECSFALK
jgi:hypothetical protein